MEKYFKSLQSIIIVTLVIIILLMRSCTGNQKVNEPKVITNTVVKYDTIVRYVAEYKPKYVTKIEYIRDTIKQLQPIDTAAILKNYFATYVYEDKQKLDSLNITIIDSVTQNKIVSRQLYYELMYPTTTITKEIYLNNREFYWGINANGTINQINYFGAGLIYKNKKKQLYSIGAGLNQEMQPIFSGGIYWKIGK